MVLSEWYIHVPEITSEASKFKENNFPLAPFTITVPSDTYCRTSLTVGSPVGAGKQTNPSGSQGKKINKQVLNSPCL